VKPGPLDRIRDCSHQPPQADRRRSIRSGVPCVTRSRAIEQCRQGSENSASLRSLHAPTEPGLLLIGCGPWTMRRTTGALRSAPSAGLRRCPLKYRRCSIPRSSATTKTVRPAATRFGDPHVSSDDRPQRWSLAQHQPARGDVLALWRSVVASQKVPVRVRIGLTLIVPGVGAALKAARIHSRGPRNQRKDGRRAKDIRALTELYEILRRPVRPGP
jgi:hypothetical protein